MEIFFNVATMLLKCFYIFIWIAGFKMCLCQRKIALEDESEGKQYLVYFVKSPYSKADHDSWLCGGALVSSTQILTAAACLVEMNRIYAIAGYKKYVSGKAINNDACTKKRKQKVVKIYVPKDYHVSTDNSAIWMSVDVGVAVVGKPYNFSDHTYRVDCSYEPSSIYLNYNPQYEQENTHAVVFGWRGIKARNLNDTSQQDLNSELHQEASIVIVNKTTCASLATNNVLKQIIDKYLLCASGHDKLDGDGVDKSLGPDNQEACPGGRDYDLTKCIDFDFRRQNNETDKQNIDENDPKEAKRNATNTTRLSSPGLCQNNHGGPLITWLGSQEMVIGVTLNSVYNHNYECVGPFLYVSTAGTAKIIKCLLEMDPVARQLCNQQMEDARYKVDEILIKWPEDTMNSGPVTQADAQKKPLFIRQGNEGNEESSLLMRPTKDLEPILDDFGRPLPPALQQEDQQVYEQQINQKHSQPYDPSQNQQQGPTLGQPNEQCKQQPQLQPYEQVYEHLYEQPQDKPAMQSYKTPQDTQLRAESYDPQQSINQPQQDSISQHKIEFINQPQIEAQKQPQVLSYNQQQKESFRPPQFESYNPPQFESLNEPQIQSFNQPQTQSFNQPQMQSFNQPQMQSFNQPQMQSFNQPQKQRFNQAQNQQFNQAQKQPANQPLKQSANEPPIQSLNQPRIQAVNQPQIQSYNNPEMEYIKLPSVDSYNAPDMPSYNQPQVSSFKLPIVEPYKSPLPIEPSFDPYKPEPFDPAPVELNQQSHLHTIDQPDVQPFAQPPLQAFEQSQMHPINTLREGAEPKFEQSFDAAQDDPQTFDQMYSQFHAPLIEPIPTQEPSEQTFEELYRTLHDSELPQEQAFDSLHAELPSEQPHLEQPFEQQFEQPFQQPLELSDQVSNTPKQEVRPENLPHEQQTVRQDDVKVRPQVPLDYPVDYGNLAARKLGSNL